MQPRMKWVSDLSYNTHTKIVFNNFIIRLVILIYQQSAMVLLMFFLLLVWTDVWTRKRPLIWTAHALLWLIIRSAYLIESLVSKKSTDGPGQVIMLNGPVRRVWNYRYDGINPQHIKFLVSRSRMTYCRRLSLNVGSKIPLLHSILKSIPDISDRLKGRESGKTPLK